MLWCWFQVQFQPDILPAVLASSARVVSLLEKCFISAVSAADLPRAPRFVFHSHLDSISCKKLVAKFS